MLEFITLELLKLYIEYIFSQGGNPEAINQKGQVGEFTNDLMYIMLNTNDRENMSKRVQWVKYYFPYTYNIQL